MKLGREQLHLLNDLASFYPLWLAQFLTGGNIKVIKISQPVQIVLGYLMRKIPFGTQIGNTVIENNSIWLQDWHIWNYVEKILVDMTAFKNGNLLPPDGSITSWGTSEDHIFIFPPKGVEYWGVGFENVEQFNKVVAQVIGFKQ